MTRQASGERTLRKATLRVWTGVMHRWLGLTLVGFPVVAGLTGSVTGPAQRTSRAASHKSRAPRPACQASKRDRHCSKGSPRGCLGSPLSA